MTEVEARQFIQLAYGDKLKGFMVLKLPLRKTEAET
jgi:hypothetical protein